MTNKVAVVGQGYVGLPLSIAVAEKNDFCFGIDISEDLVERLNKGLVNDLEYNKRSIKKVLKKNLYRATTSYKVIQEADIVVFCLPTPIKSGKPDLAILNNSFRRAKKFIKPTTILILESSVDPGLTRQMIRHFPLNDIAYSPERIDPLNKKWEVKKC